MTQAYDYGFNAGYMGEIADVYAHISHPSMREQDEFMYGYYEGKEAFNTDLAFIQPCIDAYLRWSNS